ncbi:hypothetical protein R1flu_024767 [Riccia fluitans]|uniref:Uncharacterized protein n=1 Tax=Riccia fluitans TaxID=41844 RepID=A0ABD1XW98_9MARC
MCEVAPESRIQERRELGSAVSGNMPSFITRIGFFILCKFMQDRPHLLQKFGYVRSVCHLQVQKFLPQDQLPRQCLSCVQLLQGGPGLMYFSSMENVWDNGMSQLPIPLRQQHSFRRMVTPTFGGMQAMVG